MFCGYIELPGHAGSLGNITYATRVGEFVFSCVYPNFGHLDNTLTVGMVQALVDEFRIEAASRTHDYW